ncbi:MAG: hypothetical protein JXA21_22585 [Anaerolineae bacterium]|nr:hypothetical protein [Anaerolineae bacterium]
MESSAHDSLGQRIGRFGALIAVVSVLGVIIIATQRLSQDSLALIIGLSCGISAMLPTLGLGYFILRRETSRQIPAERQQTPAAIPPVIVVTPSMLPGYNNTPQRPAYIEVEPLGQSAGGPRTFTIVGGEE